MPGIPESALAAGFVGEPGGVHTSKTMMLADLRHLLAACPVTATPEEYRAAVIDDNVLLKQTATTRYKTHKLLRQLYTLDLHVVLFRALRRLWDADDESQPLLALLCALARDPLLRATAEPIADTPVGQILTPEILAAQINDTFPGRYSGATVSTTGRNIASSWQQSGHLQGKFRKVRAQATAGPAATAYALLLGYLCNERGMALFTTPWARLLDAPPGALDAQAFAASQRGWLDYRRIGDIADIGFSFPSGSANGGGGRG